MLVGEPVGSIAGAHHIPQYSSQLSLSPQNSPIARLVLSSHHPSKYSGPHPHSTILHTGLIVGAGVPVCMLASVVEGKGVGLDELFVNSSGCLRAMVVLSSDSERLD